MVPTQELYLVPMDTSNCVLCSERTLHTSTNPHSQTLLAASTILVSRKARSPLAHRLDLIRNQRPDQIRRRVLVRIGETSGSISSSRQ